MKYRKKPVEVEALQYDGKNKHECREFIGLENIASDSKTIDLFIPTLEGMMRASLGDWIIKGVKGEFYPCKPDIFEKTYEKVENT